MDAYSQVNQAAGGSGQDGRQTMVQKRVSDKEYEQMLNI